MNRNYGYRFATEEDEKKHKDDPCGEHYKGPHAFSEPETRNIRDFLLDWNNTEVVLNLHSFGNHFITPMIKDTRDLSEERKKNLGKAYRFFKHINETGMLPAGMNFSHKHTDFEAQGEASDWMLHELGMYSLSPYLGNEKEKD